MRQLSLDLPNTTYHWLNSQVKTNHFANINEYLQNLIDKEQQQQSLQQSLQQAITEGIESSISSHSFDEIIEKTRKELKASE
jgi:antitoxin ParD1/3/4